MENGYTQSTRTANITAVFTREGINAGETVGLAVNIDISLKGTKGPQKFTVKIDGKHFESIGKDSQTRTLKKQEGALAYQFKIRAQQAGPSTLTITALHEGEEFAVKNLETRVLAAG